jgi:hypothetical protein
MTMARVVSVCCTLLLSFVLAVPARSQGATRTPKPKHGIARLFFPTDQDAIVPITSIEWGAPDRLSFTSRYVHMFQKERDYKRVLHNFTVTLSPGQAGGRLGAGYLNVWNTGTSSADRKKKTGVTLLSEARVVALRTWGHPIAADAGRTFAGVELRTSVTGVVNVGVGYYAPVGSSPGDRKSFFGLHAGVGM